MNIKRAAKSEHGMNLVPMINVIFLMLIFFMVAGKVETLDIFAVNLPKAEHTKNGPAQPAVIHMAADGRLAMNEDLVKKEDLGTIIAAILLNHPGKEISIKADASVPASQIVELMQLIQKLGGKNISIMTQVVQ